MNELYISPAARRDLVEIKEYIAAELENPRAALSVVEKITKAMGQLRHHAYMGAALSSIAKVDSDYHFLVSGSYMVFYRVLDREVYVDRVLYGRRDYLRVLLEEQ